MPTDDKRLKSERITAWVTPELKNKIEQLVRIARKHKLYSRSQ